MSHHYPKNKQQWRLAIAESLRLDASEGRARLEAGTFPFQRLEQWLREAYTEGYNPEFLPALLRNQRGLIAWVYGDGPEPFWPGQDLAPL